ncbi:hypothetical protein AGDE_04410 [Angomonas deanei]|nr:hypothetical protein AGDE_04410 [Angomonas deanei]|eukprot:EPY39518.1 hypothetical protein AGDE_04410 [Angomonas deanei]
MAITKYIMLALRHALDFSSNSHLFSHATIANELIPIFKTVRNEKPAHGVQVTKNHASLSSCSHFLVCLLVWLFYYTCDQTVCLLSATKLWSEEEKKLVFLS